MTISVRPVTKVEPLILVRNALVSNATRLDVEIQNNSWWNVTVAIERNVSHALKKIKECGLN